MYFDLCLIWLKTLKKEGKNKKQVRGNPPDSWTEEQKDTWGLGRGDFPATILNLAPRPQQDQLKLKF